MSEYEIFIAYLCGFFACVGAGVCYVRVFDIKDVYSEGGMHPITAWDILFPSLFWPLTLPFAAFFVIILSLEWIIKRFLPS